MNIIKKLLSAILVISIVSGLMVTSAISSVAAGSSTGVPVMDAIFSDDNSTKSNWDAVVNNVKTWTHETGTDYVIVNHNNVAGWQLTKQTYKDIEMTVKVDEPTPKNPYGSICTRSFLFGAASAGNYPAGYALTIYKNGTDNWIQLHYLDGSALGGAFIGGYIGDFTDKEVGFRVVDGEFTLIVNGADTAMFDSTISNTVTSLTLDNYGEGGSVGILSWDSGSTYDAKMSITYFEEIVRDPSSTGAPIMDAIFSDDGSTKSGWDAVVNNVKTWRHLQGTDYVRVNHSKIAGWQLTKQTYSDFEMTVRVDEPTPKNPYNAICTRSFLFGASSGGNYPAGYALTICKNGTDNWIQLHYLDGSALGGTFIGGLFGDYTDKEVGFRVVDGEFTLVINGVDTAIIDSTLANTVPSLTLSNYGEGGSIGILSWDSGSTYDARMAITSFRDLTVVEPCAEVTADSENVNVGDEIEFTVTVSGLEETKSMSVRPSYDSETFELVSGTWQTEAVLSGFDVQSGSGVIAWRELTDANTGIFKFVLRAKAPADSAEIGCEVKYQQANGTLAVIGTTPATVSVTEVHVHSFGEWVVTLAPTIETTGTLTRECECGETETFTLPVLALPDYTYEETKEPTCEEAGAGVYRYTKDNQIFEFEDTIAPSGHDYDFENIAYTWEWNDEEECYYATATVKCKNDETHVLTETVKATSEITKTATCTEQGEITYTATFTDQRFGSDTKQVDTETIEHSYGDYQYDENGHWRECSECHGKIDEGAHTYGDPTYSGNRTHTRVCTVCGYELVEDCTDEDGDGKCDVCGEQLYIVGDYNGDGIITSDDAIYMLDMINGEAVAELQPLRDFNKDGDIDSKDALWLLYHVFFKDDFAL